MLDSKDRPTISPELMQIILGYLMGDGYLNEAGALTVDQGVDQLKFVEWMYEKLKPLLTNTSKISKVHYPKGHKLEGVLRSYRFNTGAWFKDLHQTWYTLRVPAVRNKSKFVKKLPPNIEQIFTPLFITVWFACDGTRPYDCRGARFEVTAFTVQERLLLKSLFQKKYKINPTITRQGVSKTGTEQWALCVLSADYDKFYSLITQDSLIQDLFAYKLCKKS